MVPSRIGRRMLRVAGAMLLPLALAGGCVVGTGGTEPAVATLLLLFPGNDTVFVDIGSGVVTSGPITTFSTVDFTAEFFAENGTPDGRVTDARFRLDVTPTNTSIVTFTRVGSFSGRLNKVTTGDTQIAFALVELAAARNVFARSVAISVN